ncbi:MAG TPA: monofunctional biosynthetic peptidoglycan transglycosylase [Deltaproteobacteria bacterium]|nr:monofunctional biosynthetic peptidoglycan transglycosylase [Deltaproteobacteria bacterium]HPR54172.1 monofunctional biosynthetic peptidoglycan transglycosylase [Deltaproteobacteria bacterium]
MIKKLLLTILAAMIMATASVLVYFIYPDVSSLKTDHPAKSAFMEYRERQWAREGMHRKIDYRWVPLKRISPFLIKAVIIAEDDKFWQHEGFDFEAMEQAFQKDLKEKEFKAGGSTISQQLAKNLYLSPSKNPLRKIREAILTWRMEKALTKRRIVELYLNYAEWGAGIFGIEAAAQHYYGKHASSLGPEEASRLATVLPNPIRFNPLGKSRYVAYRSKRIYRIMVARGIVIPEFEEVMTTPDEPVPEPENEVQTTEATTGGIDAVQDGSKPDRQAESVEGSGQPAPEEQPEQEPGAQPEESPREQPSPGGDESP